MKLEDPEPPFSDEDLRATERGIGVPLPKVLVQFLTGNNGGNPPRPMFRTLREEEYLERFLSIAPADNSSAFFLLIRISVSFFIPPFCPSLKPAEAISFALVSMRQSMGESIFGPTNSVAKNIRRAR